MSHCILKIALDTPLDRCFDYRWSGAAPAVGQLALVRFGRREIVGLIVDIKGENDTDVPQDKLKDAIALRHQLTPLSDKWLALCGFAADYYQRPLGEVALPSLPKNLRTLKTTALDNSLKKLTKIIQQHEHDPQPASMPTLNLGQQEAVDTIAGAQAYAPILLYGVTGSGKTEVYLQAAARMLAQHPDGQILILVPEINLTPQLEGNIRNRFPKLMVATLHSSLAEGERTRNWLAAHLGHARIILGTRLAVLASLPCLKLIVIDEEHDVSYKQQEGLRYSARDLAVWRAWQENIPIVLGSATPALESWQHAQSGRYQKLVLRERAVKDASLPVVRLLNLDDKNKKKNKQHQSVEGLTPELVQALEARLASGEQSLLFLNRRGYAPVINCDACGWISHCTRCTAFMVLHKPDHRLRCHHCSLELRIPAACPTCGNVDLHALGRGTQRIEENLQQRFPSARILRIDADSTRRKGSAQAAFERMHQGEVDILIGTQMVAKGHDFKNLTLVGILNPDTALFAQDYRASERLFAQLMQVAGRAGRVAQKDGGNASEVLIQTRYPHHPLYEAVMQHDYEHFAHILLQERHQASLPPYAYQAMLRAEAPKLSTVLDFLEQAKQIEQTIAHHGIIVNDPIPMSMTRIANLDRAQLLVESPSRPALQTFLKIWLAALRDLKSRVKWSLEVDPMDI